ncbi:HTH domain-containing protein [Aeromonas caviae]
MSNKANNNNNEKQVENFTTVWDSVRRAKTVNGLQFKAIDKLLYSYLLGWQVSKDDPNNKKVTKVNSSVRELQQELGVSKGTIETSLKTLEKMGLIVIKSGGVGFSNEYDVRKFSDVESTNVEIKVD